MKQIYHIRPLYSQIAQFLDSIDDCFVVNILSTPTRRMPRLMFIYKGKAYFVRILRNYTKTAFENDKNGRKLINDTLAKILKAQGNVIITYSLDEFVRFFLDEVANV